MSIVQAAMPQTPAEAAGWAIGTGVLSLPTWIDWLKDVSVIAATLAPIFALLLTILMISETRMRIRAAKQHEEANTDRHISE